MRVLRFETIDSTNFEALRRARAGESGPLWLVAERQSAGRGRRGRAWASPPGNLYATLLAADLCAPAVASQLSFVAAIALHDALCAASPTAAPALRFKWPNDLLLGDRKIAGILVEGETLKEGRFAAAIGIGVNCGTHPADAAFPAMHLAAADPSITSGSVFAALVEAMPARLALWAGGLNFAAIRQAWLAHAARLGEAITLRTPAVEEGTFDGIDEQGRLLLRDRAGARRAFAAADVQFAHAEALA